MKVTLCVAFFLVVLAVASAKSCTDSDDCGKGQCCAGFTPFRGTCRKMTKEGKKCLVDEPVFPFNDIHIVACPCDEGLECVAKEGSKKKNDGVCVDPDATTTEEPQTTSAGGSSEETTDDQSTSGEVTKDQSTSGEVTQDQSTSGEVTQDQSTSGDGSQESGQTTESSESGQSQ